MTSQLWFLFRQVLKRKEDELEYEREKLICQKITYQQRLALKMKKRLSEDQLPWNRKDESEEEEVVELDADDGQALTSTASGMLIIVSCRISLLDRKNVILDTWTCIYYQNI